MKTNEPDSGLKKKAAVKRNLLANSAAGVSSADDEDIYDYIKPEGSRYGNGREDGTAADGNTFNFLVPESFGDFEEFSGSSDLDIQI